MGLITVSDRANAGLYPSGDLSGLAMRECCESFPNFFQVYKQAIVSDDKELIKE